MGNREVAEKTTAPPDPEVERRRASRPHGGVVLKNAYMPRGRVIVCGIRRDPPIPTIVPGVGIV